MVPLATVAVIKLLLKTVNEAAGTPPNFTLVTAVNAEPVMVTNVPVLPVAGVNDVITGKLGTTKY